MTNPLRILGRPLLILLLASTFLVLPSTPAQATALFCDMEITGVRVTNIGRLLVRAQRLTEPENDQFIMVMCNVRVKEGAVEMDVCKAWHSELLAALHTERKITVQLGLAALQADNLGTTCGDLVHHAQYWDALTAIEAK